MGKRGEVGQTSITILIGESKPDAVNVMTEAAISIPDVVVGGVARSREMLLAKIKNFAFDLLLLSLDDSLMGGLELVDEVRKTVPDLMIIMVSDPETADPEITVKALEKGANDCLVKPLDAMSSRYKEFRLQLITLTGLLKGRKAFSKTKNHRKPVKPILPNVLDRHETPLNQTEKQAVPQSRITSVNLVVIASSTGGPGALVKILPNLPADIGVPVLLVQHMPSHMTSSFAKSLNSKSSIEVIEAMDGDEILPSKVYVAPGGRHMTVSRQDKLKRRFIRLNDDPPVNSVRPSADMLFRSVANSFNGNILAVILTGMGRDGKNGVELMKRKGCFCLTQSPQSCVVYGMPKAVVDCGLSDEAVDLEQMYSRIISIVKQGG